MAITINHSPVQPLEFRFISATSMSVEPEVRGFERPRVPNYALRRLVVGAIAIVALCVTSIGMLGIVASMGSTPASASASATVADAQAPAFHVAESGDTMWAIASTYRGSVDHGRYLDALIRRNSGAGVQSGQAVWLP